jgi:hypothetical protein
MGKWLWYAMDGALVYWLRCWEERLRYVAVFTLVKTSWQKEYGVPE